MHLADFGSQFEKGNTRTTWLSFLAVLVVALLHWAPYLDAGMPYFHREDEAHHFNRVVEMAKSGDLDPHYFHKPSLHFYLRLPAVIAGYIATRRTTPIQSIKELRTKDTFGVADYSFSASHPRVVHWVRGVSLALALLTVGLTFWITLRLTHAPIAAVTAGLLVALSPSFTLEATVVGVDIVMTAFILLTVSVALRALHRDSLSLLIGAGFLAGLAVSSKYNALPVVFVPFIAALAGRHVSLATFCLPFIASAIGFIAGSPYILSSLPLFADHLGYEVWHYGIAGHEGHTGEPGLGQLFHYSSWLAVDGVGILAVIVALLGTFLLLRGAVGSGVTTLAFPILFTTLMCMQRANFERNMVAVIPFVAIAFGIGVQFILKRLPMATRHPYLIGLAALLPLFQPFVGSVLQFPSAVRPAESRANLLEWLQTAHREGDIAIAGQLQPAAAIVQHPGVERFDERRTLIQELASNGFRWIVTTSAYVPPPESNLFLRELDLIPGETAQQRIVSNPSIRRFEVISGENAEQVFNAFRSNIVLPTCIGTDPGEDYCWLSTRTTELSVVKAALRGATLSIMSPWENQTVSIRSSVGIELKRFDTLTPNTWHTVKVDADAPKLTINISEIHSPAERLGTSDTRRLGLAVRLIPAR